MGEERCAIQEAHGREPGDVGGRVAASARPAATLLERVWGSTSGRERRIVVRFSADFRHILDMLDRVIRADDEDRPGEQPIEASPGDETSVVLPERGVAMVARYL